MRTSIACGCCPYGWASLQRLWLAVAGMAPIVIGLMNAHSVKAQSPIPGIQALPECTFLMLSAEKRVTVYFEGEGIAPAGWSIVPHSASCKRLRNAAASKTSRSMLPRL